ncbi:protein containing DUF342, partial [Candidatus Magnetomorum sp. HK-1]
MNKKQIHHIKGNLSSRKKQYNYPGHLKIDGDIESGCQVTADLIEVNNIVQAEVRVRTGIIIHEAAKDSKIESSGYIEADKIVNSIIRAKQDIIVRKQILFSRIETNENCLIPNGLIESSEIMAYRSIEALTIKSTSASPCSLIIGILCLDDQDQKVKDLYFKLKDEKKQLYSELENAEQTIKETTQLKQKIKAIKPSLKQKITHLKQTNNTEALKELDPFFKQLNKRMESAFANLTEALSAKENILKKINSFDHEQLEISENDYFLQKQDRINRSIQNYLIDPPTVRVHG